jgi:glycosyltransferase involved in cell wall biosynthesis
MSLVTVVIPCRDRGRVIEDAVDSVFAQTHPAVEIVVVDDGSTDAFTRRVLAGFDWPRTTLVRHEVRNAASARNLALRGARGAYVCCLEAGDRLAPSYLERAVAALEGAAALDFVTAGWRSGGGVELDVRPDDCGLVSLLAGLPHPAGVTRVAAVRDAGGYDEALAEGGADHDLWLRRVAAGRGGFLLAEPLLFRRGDTRLPAAFLRKHAALYERHVMEVLGRREALLAAAWAVQQALPADAASPDQRRQLEQAKRHIDELEAAIADARFQVAHVRGSLSWRLTEPVRALVRLFTRARPASSGSMPPSPGAPAR